MKPVLCGTGRSEETTASDVSSSFKGNMQGGLLTVDHAYASCVMLYLILTSILHKSPVLGVLGVQLMDGYL